MDLRKVHTLMSYSSAGVRMVIHWTLVIFLFLAPSSASAYDLLLGTGEVGSFSYFSGRVLCRTINSKISGINCKVQAAEEEIDNLTNLQAGSLDLAIINSNILDEAVNKSGQFQFLDINYSSLSILTPLYDNPVGIIVRSNSGISTLNDLKGKRINAGAPGSIERRAMELILKAKGWAVSDFKRFEELPTSHAQDTMAFCQGTVQAMVTIGVHPSQTTQRLIENCKGVVLDINDDAIDTLVDSRAPCWKTEIKVAADSIAARTFGTREMLVASSSVDQETAYAIVKALYKNKMRLQKSHPALSLYPVQESSKGIEGLQLHQGAEQFFSEN
jgi:uncharacterized protein